MANSKETYQYIADPLYGTWTVKNEKGVLVIVYMQGRFHVDGHAFLSITNAREYAFDKLGIPQLLPS